MHQSVVSPHVACVDGRPFVRLTQPRPFHGKLRIASWNVEGLTEIEMFELINVMKHQRIDILSMQETHIKQSPYDVTPDGFLVPLSGSSTSDREYAGVGFLVAPWIRHAVCSFVQLSNRTAVMKIRAEGGKVAVCCVYAPHSGWPWDDTQLFSSDWRQLSSVPR